MPFHSRNFLRPVKSDKHELTWSNLAQDASSVQVIVLAKGTDSADKNASTEVEVGAAIRSIYFEFHFSANVITNPKVIHWFVVGKRTGETIGTPSTYYTDERSSIFKRGMEMLVKDTSTVFKRIFVVKVPKKFQRIAKNMNIEFRYIATSAEAINACGIAIYKEFY